MRIIEEIRKQAADEHLPVMRERTAALLSALTLDKKPEQVLEIGTCTGLSGITALAAGACKLTTLELDEQRADRARENFKRSGYYDRVTLINGDCREILRYLEGNTYDLIILDGPKADLDFQYETCLGLLSCGGIIFIDDIDYHGMIRAETTPHKQRTIITAMRAFIEKIRADGRVRVKFYEFDDGVAVAEKL